MYRSSHRNFVKKEALAQVFSCEFCEISKNIFFTEHLATASEIHQVIHLSEVMKFYFFGFDYFRQLFEILYL